MIGHVRGDDHQLAPLPQHGAEIGLRRLGAEAEEAQARRSPGSSSPMVVDMVMTITGMHVGQHFAEQDRAHVHLPESRAASTNSRRPRAKVTPRMLRAKNGMLTMAMAIERVDQAGPEHGDDGQRQQDIGKGHQHVDEPHQQIVEPAAGIAGDDADQ